MAVKQISKKYEKQRLQETGQGSEHGKKQRRNYLVVLLWIILFAFSSDVLIETTFDVVNEYYSFNQQQFKVCLAQFISQKCEISNPNAKCKVYYDCLKGIKQNQVGIMTIVKKFIYFFAQEIEQNYFIPSIFSAILVVMKIFSNPF